MRNPSKTLFTCAVLFTSLLLTGKILAAGKMTTNAGKATVDVSNYFLVNTEDNATLTGLTLTVGLACWFTRDSDGDGKTDSTDNCPGKKNPEQDDEDADGFGDVCDSCEEEGPVMREGQILTPAAYNGCLPSDAQKDAKCYDKAYSLNTDQDGDNYLDNKICDLCIGIDDKTQRDSDRDGVGDNCDICPYVENPSPTDALLWPKFSGDKDEDGIPNGCDNCDNVDNCNQADRDADRVGDVCDNCPDDKNGKGDRSVDNQADSDRDGTGDACDETPDGGDPNCVYVTARMCVPNSDPMDMDCDAVRDTPECDICPTRDGTGGALGCPPSCILAIADAVLDKNDNNVDDRCEPCEEGTFQTCKTSDGKDGCQACLMHRWGSCGSDPGHLAHCPTPEEECEEGETTSKGCETVKVGLCEEAIKKCQSDGTWEKVCGTRPIEGCDDKCALPPTSNTENLFLVDPDQDGFLDYRYSYEPDGDKVTLVIDAAGPRPTNKPIVAVNSAGKPCDPCPNTPPAISEHPPFTLPAWHVPGPGGLKVPGLSGGTLLGDLVGKVTIVPTEMGGTRVIKLPLADSARRSLLEDVTKFMTRVGDPQGRPGTDGYNYDNDGDGKNDSCNDEKPPKDKICAEIEYRNTELEKRTKFAYENGSITKEEEQAILSEDKDRDGIPAWCDNCPEKSNTSQGKYDCPDIPPVDAGCPADYLKPKEPTGGEKPKRPERPTRPAKCDDLEKELNYEREDLMDALDALDPRDEFAYMGDVIKTQIKLGLLKLPAECQAPTGGIERPAKIMGPALVEALAGKLGSAPATTENMKKAAEEFGKRRSVAYGGVPGAFYDMRPVTNKDSDGDGYYDFCDNCPYVPNKDQADRDGDGVGDSCDNCPYVANPKQENADGDEYGDICDPGDDDGDGKCDTCCVSCCCQGPACLPQDCFVEVAGSQRDPDGDGRDNFKIIDGVECDACPLADNGMDADHDGTPDGCDPCPNAYDKVHADADQDGIPNVCDNCMDDRNIDQTDDDGDGHGNACDTLVGPGPGPDPLPPPPFSCLEGQIASDADGDGVMDTCSTIEGEGSVSKAECADAGGTVNPWGAEELRDRIGRYLTIKEMREVCLGRKTLEDQTTHQPIGDIVCDENGNIIGDCVEGSTKLTGEGCGCTLRGKGLTHPETLVNIFVWMLMVIVPALLMRRSLKTSPS